MEEVVVGEVLRATPTFQRAVYHVSCTLHTTLSQVKYCVAYTFYCISPKLYCICHMLLSKLYTVLYKLYTVLYKLYALLYKYILFTE